MALSEPLKGYLTEIARFISKAALAATLYYWKINESLLKRSHSSIHCGLYIGLLLQIAPEK